MHIDKIRHEDDYLVPNRTMEEEVKFRERYEVQCKCGNKLFIRDCQDYIICNWCGKRVYRSGKNKFERELRKRLGNVK